MSGALPRPGFHNRHRGVRGTQIDTDDPSVGQQREKRKFCRPGGRKCRTCEDTGFHYGAWADLRVTAEGSTGKLPVTFPGETDPVISVPYNGTGQRASAAWLRRYGWCSNAGRF
jgi:hypothetical protein